MLKTDAIQSFLTGTGNSHLTDLYTPEMEVQVNVLQGRGRPTGGEYLGKRWRGWTDGKTTWKSFRIPWNAKTQPDYRDTELKFNLSEHVEGIGMTGWNWYKRQSEWVGYDFDSIANHEQGLTDEELNEVIERLMKLDYTTIVKSTSGNGYHMYIHLDEPIPTETHSAHAALARSILSVLSMEVGFDFFNSVDACGMVLWVYHRKQENTDGLSLLKEGNKFQIQKIPSNWRDHIDVTTGRVRKVVPKGADVESFNELTSSMRRFELDVEHRRLLDWLRDNAKRDAWWDSDYHMLVCHTFDLKEAHKELSLKGIFHTDSSGSTAQNCYAFPAECGSWVVRRHSLNVREHPSWSVDSTGWTRCVYNAIPDLPTCARSNEGIEDSSGAYVFQTLEAGMQALANAGIHIEMSDEDRDKYSKRNMSIKEKNDGRLIVSFVRDAQDTAVRGFLTNKKGDRWERVVHLVRRKKDIQAPDFLVRHLIADEQEAGWWIYTRRKWVQQSRSNIVTVLLSQQTVQTRNDIELMMSKAILNPWELVNIPFREEYPGNRQWNRGAASFSCTPEEGPCSTWLEILEHVGEGLNDAVKEDQWCNDNAIYSGKEYLLTWIASMFQRPTEPLPYLFFVGPQNCGKSTLHEALSTLMRNGYVRADNALVSQQGFNGELAGAVLCVVEETNINKSKDAENRIKDWVTGKTISIRALHKSAYDLANTTHWIQCANDPNYCPVFPGDTRIVVCRVGQPKQDIPKGVLFDRIEKEKRAFLNLITSVELPPAPGRLAIPCLRTADKALLESSNMDQLESFFSEVVKTCNGNLVEFEVFYNRFLEWLPYEERSTWTKSLVSRRYPREFPHCKGKQGSQNITYCGNIALPDREGNYPEPQSYIYFQDLKGRLQTKGV